MRVVGLLAMMAAGCAEPTAVDARRIDEIFASVNNRQSPGCVAAALRGGVVEFAQGYGMADLEHATPISTTTAFDLGSITKQLTAAAINLLVVDGRLSLDDDVRKYVPEIPLYQAPITIRQLMHHTSGLRDYIALFDLAQVGRDQISYPSMLAMLARQGRLHFAPGEQFSYTNSGYALLSLVVERVSGQSLPAFTEERLFRPLGMTSTGFRVGPSVAVSNASLGYGWQCIPPWRIWPCGSATWKTRAWAVPGGASSPKSAGRSTTAPCSPTAPGWTISRSTAKPPLSTAVRRAATRAT
jgi:CubicO group peptidase (beta-lactamase class C family)